MGWLNSNGDNSIWCQFDCLKGEINEIKRSKSREEGKIYLETNERRDFRTCETCKLENSDSQTRLALINGNQNNSCSSFFCFIWTGAQMNRSPVHSDHAHSRRDVHLGCPACLCLCACLFWYFNIGHRHSTSNGSSSTTMPGRPASRGPRKGLVAASCRSACFGSCCSDLVVAAATVDWKGPKRSIGSDTLMMLFPWAGQPHRHHSSRGAVASVAPSPPVLAQLTEPKKNDPGSNWQYACRASIILYQIGTLFTWTH